jgi:hypothetical protein
MSKPTSAPIRESSQARKSAKLIIESISDFLFGRSLPAHIRKSEIGEKHGSKKTKAALAAASVV